MGKKPRGPSEAASPKRTAIVFVHGQGEHLPMAAARDLAEAVYSPSPGEARYVSDTRDLTSEASRIAIDARVKGDEDNHQGVTSGSDSDDTIPLPSDAPPAASTPIETHEGVDIFEYYWSHLKSGNRLSDVWLWFRRLIHLPVEETPAPIVPVRQTIIYFAEIGAIFLAAFAMLTASVLFSQDIADSPHNGPTERSQTSTGSHEGGLTETPWSIQRQLNELETRFDVRSREETLQVLAPQIALPAYRVRMIASTKFGDAWYLAIAEAPVRGQFGPNRLRILKATGDKPLTNSNISVVPIVNSMFHGRPEVLQFRPEIFDTDKVLVALGTTEGEFHTWSFSSETDQLDQVPEEYEDYTKTSIRSSGEQASLSEYVDGFFFLPSDGEGNLRLGVLGDEGANLRYRRSGASNWMIVEADPISYDWPDLDKLFPNATSKKFITSAASAPNSDQSTIIIRDRSDNVEYRLGYTATSAQDNVGGSTSGSSQNSETNPREDARIELPNQIGSWFWQSSDGGIEYLAADNQQVFGISRLPPHDEAAQDRILARDAQGAISIVRFSSSIVIQRHSLVFTSTSGRAGELTAWQPSTPSELPSDSGSFYELAADIDLEKAPTQDDTYLAFPSITRIKNLAPAAFRTADSENALPISRDIPIILLQPCATTTDQLQSGFYALYEDSNADSPPPPNEESHLLKYLKREIQAPLACPGQIDNITPTNSQNQRRVFVRNSETPTNFGRARLDGEVSTFLNMSATAANFDQEQHLVVATALNNRDGSTEYYLRLDSISAKSVERANGKSFADSTLWQCQLQLYSDDSLVGLSVSTNRQRDGDTVRIAVATPSGIALKELTKSEIFGGEIPLSNDNREHTFCQFDQWLNLGNGHGPASVTISDDGQTLVTVNEDAHLAVFDWPDTALSSGTYQPVVTTHYHYRLHTPKESKTVAARWISWFLEGDFRSDLEYAFVGTNSTIETCTRNDKKTCFNNTQVNVGDTRDKEESGGKSFGTNFSIVQFVSDDLLMVSLPGGVVLQSLSPLRDEQRKLGRAHWFSTNDNRLIADGTAASTVTKTRESANTAEGNDDDLEDRSSAALRIVKAGALVNDPATLVTSSEWRISSALAEPNVQLIAWQAGELPKWGPLEPVRFQVVDAAPYPTIVRGILFFVSLASPFLILVTIIAIIANYWIRPLRRKDLAQPDSGHDLTATEATNRKAFPRPEDRMKRRNPPMAEKAYIFFGLLGATAFSVLVATGLHQYFSHYPIDSDASGWREYLERALFLVIAIASASAFMCAIQLVLKAPALYADLRQRLIERSVQRVWLPVGVLLTIIAAVTAYRLSGPLGLWTFIPFLSVILAIWIPDLLKWLAQIAFFVALPVVFISLIVHAMNDPRFGLGIVRTYALFGLGIATLVLVWDRRLIPALLIAVAALPLAIPGLVEFGLQGLVATPGAPSVLNLQLDEIYLAILFYTLTSVVMAVLLALYDPSYRMKGTALLMTLLGSLALYILGLEALIPALMLTVLIALSSIAISHNIRGRSRRFKANIYLGSFILSVMIVIGYVAFGLLKSSSITDSVSRWWVQDFAEVYPTWTIAFLFLIAIVGGVGWVVSRSFLVPIMADTARYLSERPKDVKLAREIREHGVDMLEKLHTSGRYHEIIVVGHSLGSIVSLDILSQLWARRVDRLMPQQKTKDELAECFANIHCLSIELRTRLRVLRTIVGASNYANEPGAETNIGSRLENQLPISSSTPQMEIDELVVELSLWINENSGNMSKELNNLMRNITRKISMQGPSALQNIYEQRSELPLIELASVAVRNDKNGNGVKQTELVARLIEGSLRKFSQAYEALLDIDKQVHDILSMDGNGTTGAPWLVSKFITLGSPLTYGPYLLGPVRYAYYPKSTAILGDMQYQMRPFPDFRFTEILPTKWINVYFKTKRIVVGDLVGGPIWRHFGSGVTDIELQDEKPNGFTFAHNQYWKSSQATAKEAEIEKQRVTGDVLPEHLARLREALQSIKFE